MSYKNSKYPSTILAASILTFMQADKDSAGGTAVEEPPKEQTPDLATFLANHPIVEIIDLEVKKIVIDAGTQPRVAIDPEAVAEYAEVIKLANKDGQPNPFSELPDNMLPVVFRDPSGNCILADGFHRYGAHKQAHEKEMRVAVREGNQREALLFSLSTNQAHGLQRTSKDKKRILDAILKDPVWAPCSNNSIARFVGISEGTVRNHRTAVGTPTERKITIRGKQTTMDTSAIGKGKGARGKKAQAKAAKKDAKKPGKNGKKQAGAIVQDDTQGMGAMHREITKIKNVLGGKKGDQFWKAMEEGSLKLTKRDITDWAGLTDLRSRSIADLVLPGTMKPWAAHKFLEGGVPEKSWPILKNLCNGSNGKYTETNDGFRVTVEKL